MNLLSWIIIIVLFVVAGAITGSMIEAAIAIAIGIIAIIGGRWGWEYLNVKYPRGGWL